MYANLVPTSNPTRIWIFCARIGKYSPIRHKGQGNIPHPMVSIMQDPCQLLIPDLYFDMLVAGCPGRVRVKSAEHAQATYHPYPTRRSIMIYSRAVEVLCSCSICVALCHSSSILAHRLPFLCTGSRCMRCQCLSVVRVTTAAPLPWRLRH